MAEYSFHEEITKRAVWTLPSPTNRAEVNKVFGAIKTYFPECMWESDDAVTVEARDDEIIFWVDVTNYEVA